jgi:uncharacterized membrane protein
MTPYFFAYIASAVVMTITDGLWIGLLARSFYLSRIGHLFAATPNWVAVGVFYLVYPVGLMYFAVVGKDSLAASATAGLLFGFFAYATYDLTNMATLKDWPLSMTLVDIAWGSAMGALAAAVGYSVLQYFS